MGISVSLRNLENSENMLFQTATTSQVHLRFLKESQ